MTVTPTRKAHLLTADPLAAAHIQSPLLNALLNFTVKILIQKITLHSERFT